MKYISKIGYTFDLKYFADSIGCKHFPDQEEKDNCIQDKSKLGDLTIQTLSRSCGLTYR